MGMAGVANPAADRTLAKYQADAKSANVVPAQAPNQVGGGQILANPSFTSASTTITTTTTAASTSTVASTIHKAAAPTGEHAALAGVLVSAIGAAVLIA